MQAIPRKKNCAGFTLVEVIATAVIGLAGIGAAVALNGAHLQLVKSSRQSNAATLALQERVEQMRLGNWRKITDPSYLAQMLAEAPKSAAPLNSPTERITISAYPDPDAATSLVVERRPDGQRVTVSSGAGLSNQRLAQVELNIAWVGQDGRDRLRATTTVISNGGISRMNLPGMGVPGGASPTEPAPAPPPSGETSPSPAPTPAPTPTPAPPPSGNGNGRGNVGGKTGKK